MTVLSTSQARAVWGPVCHPTLVVFSPTAGKGAVRLSIDYRLAEAARALDAACVAHGVTLRAGVCGCYVCRLITDGKLYSLHAYAVAIDLNWDTNDYSSNTINPPARLITDFPKVMTDAVKAMRTKNGKQVWVWGGDFNNNDVEDDNPYDAMHFQVGVSPVDLATGIDWSTVPGDAFTPDPNPSEDYMAAISGAEQRLYQLDQAGVLVCQWYGTYGSSPTSTICVTDPLTGAKRDPDGFLYWRTRVLAVLADKDGVRLDALEHEFAALVANKAGLSLPSDPAKPTP